jgi:hypothetical protein
MGKQKDNLFSTTLQKQVDEKLVYISEAEEKLYRLFVKNLALGQTVDVFFDANKDDGTLAQLAKIHKCIREIAKETGNDFEDIKDLIKVRSGLCFKKNIDGEIITKCKSFAKASKEDLGFVIEALITLGDLCNINCR